MTLLCNSHQSNCNTGLQCATFRPTEKSIWQNMGRLYKYKFTVNNFRKVLSIIKVKKRENVTNV